MFDRIARIVVALMTTPLLVIEWLQERQDERRYLPLESEQYPLPWCTDKDGYCGIIGTCRFNCWDFEPEELRPTPPSCPCPGMDSFRAGACPKYLPWHMEGEIRHEGRDGRCSTCGHTEECHTARDARVWPYGKPQPMTFRKLREG